MIFDIESAPCITPDGCSNGVAGGLPPTFGRALPAGL